MKKLILFLSLIPILSHSSTIVQLKTQLEQKSGCILTISSGDRSVKHNKEVGGSKNSYHLVPGMALDLTKSKCTLSYKEIGKVAQKWFSGVIYYDRHIHLDLRPGKHVFYYSKY